MGLEPTTLGTTIRCSNRLSYIHHCIASFLCAAKIVIFLHLQAIGGIFSTVGRLKNGRLALYLQLLSVV